MTTVTQTLGTGGNPLLSLTQARGDPTTIPWPMAVLAVAHSCLRFVAVPNCVGLRCPCTPSYCGNRACKSQRNRLNWLKQDCMSRPDKECAFRLNLVDSSAQGAVSRGQV